MPDIRWNGREIPLISLDQLTLDEAILVYDYSKLTLDQIPDLEGFHPGLIAALIHISAARAEPNVSSLEIRRAVGKTPVSDLETIFAGISEEVDTESVPPIEPTNSAVSNGGSGDTSTPTGESAPASSPQPSIGPHGWGTGATSDPRISAA